MNLTLRQLSAFAAVAELGSFTAAAGRMHLTQSALSVLVRELEKELGARLLDRHTRRVQLTELGAALLPRAKSVFIDLEQAVADVVALRDKKRGNLRLAMPQLMASTLGARAIAAFHRRYPDVRIELHEAPTDQLVGRLLSGEAEFAIGVEVPSSEDVVRRELLRDRHWLVCPPDHPLASLPRVRWRDLQGVPFIAPTRDFVRWLEPVLPSPDLRPLVAHTAAYVSTALGLAAAGLGVTMVPTYGQALASAWGLAIKPLVAPVFEREVQIYSCRGRGLSPTAEAFIKEIESITGTAPKPKVVRPSSQAAHGIP